MVLKLFLLKVITLIAENDSTDYLNDRFNT